MNCNLSTTLCSAVIEQPIDTISIVLISVHYNSWNVNDGSSQELISYWTDYTCGQKVVELECED